MKVLILAGGRGTRLGELTKDTPKPMIEINGKPFLEYQINYLKQHKLTDIVLCVGYLHEQIIDYFGDGSKFGVKIQYSIEETPLGTGGAIKNAETLLEQDNEFVVINGDTFLELNYSQFLENCDFDYFATCVVDRLGISAGIYVLNEHVFGFIPKDINSSIEDILMTKFIINRYPSTKDFIDIGTLPGLSEFKNLVKGGI